MSRQSAEFCESAADGASLACILAPPCAMIMARVLDAIPWPARAYCRAALSGEAVLVLTSSVIGSILPGSAHEVYVPDVEAPVCR